MRLDQTSSDSQCSPTEELSSKETELIETSPSPSDTLDAPPIEIEKPFEQAGVFITDDDITINVSTTTGLRKTGFSDNLYDDGTPRKGLSKIPRSPMTRRKSVDNCSIVSDTPATTGLPIMSRKMPVYRSVRKPAVGKESTNSIVTNVKQDIGTWSGRATTKKRPSLGADTFQLLSNNNNNNNGSTTNLNQKTLFQRNSDARASQCQYDQNGRRIKSASTATSPAKQSTSPLAQQILEAAESAKNDSQMLEKMKLLLSKYTTKSNKSTASPTRGRSTATPSPAKNKDEYEDFTTAWVNSNGSLDRTSNCCTPVKAHSKRSSAASSIESTSYGKDGTVTARRDRGTSRIPAPIRQNTELY